MFLSLNTSQEQQMQTIKQGKVILQNQYTNVCIPDRFVGEIVKPHYFGAGLCKLFNLRHFMVNGKKNDTVFSTQHKENAR